MGDAFWGTCCHDEAPLFARFGAEVDDVIGIFDHIEVVFDEDDGISFIDEFVEDGKERGDIVRVEACCGFIEEVDGFPCGAFGQFSGEFDPLCFAAGEGGHLLADFEVSQADRL